MVEGVGSSASTYQTAGDKAAATLAGNFDDFLVLLTTQLLHQDPTDPMDSNQFTQQLVQFAGVEQQIKANQNLETLASLTLMNHQTSLAGYLGKDALVPGLIGNLDPTGENGQQEIHWRYNLPASANETKIEVRDDKGHVVYTLDAKTTAGTHDFKWDGTLGGDNVAEPGAYSIKVTAKDSEGELMDVGIAVRATVQSVDLTGAEALFNVGGNYVYQTDIVQLYEN